MLDLNNMFAPQMHYANVQPQFAQPQAQASPRPFHRAFGTAPMHNPRSPLDGGQRDRDALTRLRDKLNRAGGLGNIKFFNDPETQYMPVAAQTPYGQGGFDNQFVSGGPDPNLNPFTASPFGMNIGSMLGRRPIY